MTDEVHDVFRIPVLNCILEFINSLSDFFEFIVGKIVFRIAIDALCDKRFGRIDGKVAAFLQRLPIIQFVFL